MLENWGYESVVLDRMSAHRETGAKLPAALIQKLVAAKNAHSGIHSCVSLRAHESLCLTTILCWQTSVSSSLPRSVCVFLLLIDSF